MRRQETKITFFALLIALFVAGAATQVSAQKINFISKYGTICMDVKGGGAFGKNEEVPGREVIAYRCQDSSNQRFYYNNNSQQIQVNDSFTCLEGVGGAVKTARCGDALPQQKWRFLVLNDGSFFIQHVQTGKVMDIEGAAPWVGILNEGKRLILWGRKPGWQGNDNQRWFSGPRETSRGGGSLRQAGEPGATSLGQRIQVPTNGASLVGLNGSNIIAVGGANIIAVGGANVVALGGNN